MRFLDLAPTQASVRPGGWALVYSTPDAESLKRVSAFAARTRGTQVFGCTSHTGVFTPQGFSRGAFALAGDDGELRVEPLVRKASAASARRTAREAAAQITERLGARPDTLILHATPGFEERILEGLEEAFEGKPPPVYGGSAADDDLSGQWCVFHGSAIEREGFLLLGLRSASPILGAFVSGYLPGRQRGVVTRASGRVALEIDGMPAAEVYDAWRGGALAEALEKPGVVLGATTIHPLGRVVDRVGNVPRYLLSHPHEVRADHGLSLFTDIAVGDEVAMMVGSEGGLLERTQQVVSRAMGTRRDAAIRGGVLIYCGGCVGVIGNRAPDVGRMYSRAIGEAPFVGAATFGEVGCFTGPTPTNRHGNLMCDTVLFT